MKENNNNNNTVCFLFQARLVLCLRAILRLRGDLRSTRLDEAGCLKSISGLSPARCLLLSGRGRSELERLWGMSSSMGWGRSELGQMEEVWRRSPDLSEVAFWRELRRERGQGREECLRTVSPRLVYQGDRLRR